MKKFGTNIKAVWGWSAFAAVFITVSGLLFGFKDVIPAYIGVGLVCGGLTLYTLISKKS